MDNVRRGVFVSKIKIISDGTSLGTKVLHNGKSIFGITKIEIDNIKKDTVVTARLTFDLVDLDIDRKSVV